MTEATRTLIQALNEAWRVALIYVLILFLLLVMMSNWVLPYFSVLKPQLMLVAVFYWTLYRPGIMPSWVVFILGLILDLANPVLPLGTHAFSYLLVVGLLRPRRRMLMGQSFMIVWVAFVIAVLLDLGVSTLMLSMGTSASIPGSVLSVHAIATILAFPLILTILVGLHRLLPPGRGMIAA